jgi:hypothetical protein
MRAYGYALESHDFSPAGWLAFTLFSWPNQMVRMLAWRAVEAVQHNFAGTFGRRPGARMIVDAPLGPGNELKPG